MRRGKSRGGLPGRWDRNQSEIVRVLEAIGGQWVDLSSIGGGVPDLLVAFRGHTLLIEVKTATGTLTDLQQDFLGSWRGATLVVRSREDLLGGLLRLEQRRG